MRPLGRRCFFVSLLGLATACGGGKGGATPGDDAGTGLDGGTGRDAGTGHDGGADDADAAQGGEDASIEPGAAVHLRILSPEPLSVDGADIATRSLDRFGQIVTVPYLTTRDTLHVVVALEPLGECVATLRATLRSEAQEARSASVSPGCADQQEVGLDILGIPKGEYRLLVEALDPLDRVRAPDAGSLASIDRVGFGDVFLVLGESTSEGYGPALGEGLWEATDDQRMDRFDHVPPGASSLDGRTLAWLGATQVSPDESGCGAPGSLGCPIYAQPTYFAGYHIALADLLAARLGHPVLVWNLAYGGHTTAALLRYAGQGLDHASVAAQIAALEPDAALVYTGVNDSVCPARCGDDAVCAALCGDPDTNARELVQWAAERVGGADHVWLAEPTPFEGGDHSMQSVVAADARIRTETGARRGPPIFAWLRHHPEELADGIHPNAAGYLSIARLFDERLATTGEQPVPELILTPARTGPAVQGIIAVLGYTPGQAVDYVLTTEDGAELSHFPALPCGPASDATADAWGLCSFRYDTILDEGRYVATIFDATTGSFASAPLEVIP